MPLSRFMEFREVMPTIPNSGLVGHESTETLLGNHLSSLVIYDSAHGGDGTTNSETNPPPPASPGGASPAVLPESATAGMSVVPDRARKTAPAPTRGAYSALTDRRQSGSQGPLLIRPPPIICHLSSVNCRACPGSASSGA